LAAAGDPESDLPSINAQVVVYEVI
jgi:hypothetical protein